MIEKHPQTQAQLDRAGCHSNSIESCMMAFEFCEASMGVVTQVCNLTPGSLRQETHV